MPCDTRLLPGETVPQRVQKIKAALDRLKAALKAKTVTVKVDARTGALAFVGWQDGRDGVTDVCAYRRLSQARSPELLAAVAAAERLAGRRVSEAAIAGGLHSHDNGKTWARH